jgi:hypothetical protein
MSLSNPGSLYLEPQSDEKHTDCLSSEYHAAAKFILGAFLWLDILACASTRSKPSLDLNHKLLLEGGNIHLDTVVGCENWVMVIIFNISTLDSWKMELERDGRLSIAELAKRGAYIEVSLRKRLAAISVYNPSQTKRSPSVARLSRAASVEITKVYALTALTYLHVVISGAHPDLPEIADSVSSTITAFGALVEKELLLNLVWPFCVTSFLASENQQGVIRAFISAEAMDRKSFGVFQTALKLIEECWRERKSGLTGHDWTYVMNSIGRPVLLV